MSFLQSGNGLIKNVISTGPVSKRYWRAAVFTMSGPQACEMFFTLGLSVGALAVGGQGGRISSVRWNDGADRDALGHAAGDLRRVRVYDVILDATEFAAFETERDYLDGLARPFFITDHAGDTFLVRLRADPLVTREHDHHKITLDMVEVLA